MHSNIIILSVACVTLTLTPCVTLTLDPNETPCVAIFGVLRRDGIVMLSYNSAYIYNITNSPCTQPLPYTMDSIPCMVQYSMHSTLYHI